jgi:hypothetical protein
MAEERQIDMRLTEVAEHIQTCVNIHGPRPGAVCARTMNMVESEQMTAFGGADGVKVLFGSREGGTSGTGQSRTPTAPSRTKSASIKPLRRISYSFSSLSPISSIMSEACSSVLWRSSSFSSVSAS